jgi:hypothetical protein
MAIRPFRTLTTAATVAMILTGAARTVSAAGSGAPRGFITVNFGTQTGSTSFTETSVLHINQEDGNVSAVSSVKSGPLFDLGAGGRVWHQLQVGVSVSRFSVKGSADISADIPHPFVFNQPRHVSGTASNLNRREIAEHVDMIWAAPLSTHLEVKAFAGPSFFKVRQDLVSNVTYTETYPYDTADFSGADLKGTSKSVVGFNAGAEMNVYFQPNVGVGVTARFARATAKLDAPLGGQVPVKAGGFHVAAGLRLRF